MIQRLTLPSKVELGLSFNVVVVQGGRLINEAINYYRLQHTAEHHKVQSLIGSPCMSRNVNYNLT